jgi:BioD-like phosphotransacetylase family protein
VGVGDVLIISASSTPRIHQILDFHADILHRGGIAGLILTCGETEQVESEVRDALIRTGLPALYVREDSAATEERLFRLYENTKLQVYDTGKIAEIEQLFEEHFDIDRFLNVFLS